MVDLINRATAPIRYFTAHTKDFHFEVAAGKFSDLFSVNKFGRTTNADSGVATDVWDGANATEDDDIWLAPTAARVHAITSNQAADTSGGAGARKIRLYGLRDWDSKEYYEDITLNGAGAVNTTQSYVIIHRMKVLECGASGPNVGDIFATAAVDGTITAMIVAGEGQTQMAVYGIGSGQRLYMVNFYGSIQRAVATASGNLSLLATPVVRTQPAVFQVKHTLGINSTGTSTTTHTYLPNNRFDGPAIIKMQVNTSANDADVSAGFDLIVEDIPS